MRAFFQKIFLIILAMLILVGCSSIEEVDQPEVPLIDGYTRHVLEATSANGTQYTCTYQLPEDYKVDINYVDPFSPWIFGQRIENDESVLDIGATNLHASSMINFVIEPKDWYGISLSDEEREWYFGSIDSYIKDFENDPSMECEVVEIEEEKYGFQSCVLDVVTHIDPSIKIPQISELRQKTLLISNNEKDISKYFCLNVTFYSDYVEKEVIENCFNSISLKIKPMDG